jgi:hypothetical protein
MAPAGFFSSNDSLTRGPDLGPFHDITRSESASEIKSLFIRSELLMNFMVKEEILYNKSFALFSGQRILFYQ